MAPSRIKQPAPQLSRGALDLAGWYPAAANRSGVIDTLNIDAPPVQVRHPWTPRPGIPVRPRPAIREQSGKLSDVYGDIYTLSKVLQEGTFAAFKIGSQMQQRCLTLMGTKQINMAAMKNIFEEGKRLRIVRSEFDAMRDVVLAPFDMLYTVTPPSVMQPRMTFRDAYMFMPLGETDLMEALYALNESVNKSLAEWSKRSESRQEDCASTQAEKLAKVCEPTTFLAQHVLQCGALELQRLHARGMLHADVKPENLFLMRNGEVLLGDYGSASPMEAVKRSGSLDYSTSEQLLHRPYNQKVDIYSLGISVLTILYSNPLHFKPVRGDARMEGHALLRRQLLEKWRQQELTGKEQLIEPGHKEAWEAVKSVMDTAKTCGPKLMGLLLRMVAADPAERPTASEVLDALRQDGILLQDTERGPLIRALLNAPPSDTRKRMNRFLQAPSAKPLRRKRLSHEIG